MFKVCVWADVHLWFCPAGHAADDWGAPVPGAGEEGFGAGFEGGAVAAADDWGAIEVADPTVAGFEAAAAPTDFAAAPAFGAAGY